MPPAHLHDVPAMAARLRRLERQNRYLCQAIVAVLLVAACALVSVAFGQRTAESVVFNGQRFELGMLKSDALARLAECCALTGSADSFFVWTKPPQSEMIGAIWFTGNKVSALKLDLDQFQDEKSAKLGLLLYRTISEMTSSQPRSMLVTEVTREIEGATLRTLFLTLPSGKSVVMEVSTMGPNAFGIRDVVDVYEELRLP